MTDISVDALEELGRIKKNIEKSYEYFKKNYDRFNQFRKFVFDTSMDSSTIALYKTLKKPQIEFNILEAYVSRLRGEFSKQEPSIEVMAGDEQPVDPNVIKIVEGHIKHILDEANRQGCEYHTYTDTLSGGFSVLKVWTEYANPRAFNQVIRLGRVYDPVLCGFDPLAREPHKGDGKYCFELYPKTKVDFQREYPDVDIKELTYARAIEGFSWTYRNNKEDIVMLGDYYERVKRKVKLVQLANQQAMTDKEYKEFMLKWQEMDRIEQPPAVIGKRTTEIETIDRYVVIENQIIRKDSTNFSMLPLVFVDGNSVLIRHEISGDVHQMTRPYVYQALGIQKLKNFAGVTLANELENLVQHKFMISQQGLPNQEDFLEAYRNVQQADVLVYNLFDPNRPEVQIPPPEVVNRVPIPPQVMETFSGTDAMTQNILGNFEMDISKLNKSQLSGTAIVESATQNNSAAMPYITSFLQSLSRVAEIIVDLIPKYYKTPRTIPIKRIDGKQEFVRINEQQGQQQQGEQQGQSYNLTYAENALNVHVEAGVNFGVQKSKALAAIIELTQASPIFAQFMSVDGLDILLDNIEIKGIDEIKQRASQFVQQQRQMAQKAAQEPQPGQVKMQTEQMKLQQKQQEIQMEGQIEQLKHQLEQMKLAAQQRKLQVDTQIAVVKAQAEVKSHTIDAAVKVQDMHHKHALERTKMAHTAMKDDQKLRHQEEKHRVQLQQAKQKPRAKA